MESWVKRVSTFYVEASSSMKLNGELNESFPLSKSMKQCYPFFLYLFIQVVNAFEYMFGYPCFGVEVLTLLNKNMAYDQSFIIILNFFQDCELTIGNETILLLTFFVKRPMLKPIGQYPWAFGHPRHLKTYIGVTNMK